MRIYTKSGDRGETSIIGGRRLSKSDLLVIALGSLDELNAHLGLAATLAQTQKELLQRIQAELFTLGAEIYDPDRKLASSITALEHEIDLREAALPPITHFTLPGGTPLNAQLHIARTVCRRAECNLVALHSQKPINTLILTYINRLSDLLFMLAREDLFANSTSEILWEYPRGEKQ